MKNVILIVGLFFMLVLPLSFFAHVNMTSDPLDYYKSQNPTITQEQIDMFKQQHGLDKPSLVRYVYWLKNIATGDAEVYKAYNMSIFPFIMIVLASLITGIAAVFILKKPLVSIVLFGFAILPSLIARIYGFVIILLFLIVLSCIAYKQTKQTVA
ncbi:MAG TPA: hypothetical protein PLE09_06375 [Caldisericia bacterium]|nr:hypothetical protein [Caldisericia bacterium]HXK52142.1 hypothetical protein [Caldisericia bacterium]